MAPARHSIVRGLLALGALGGVLVGPGSAAPVDIQRRTRAILELRALPDSSPDAARRPSLRLEVPPGRAETARLAVRWPDEGSGVGLAVRVHDASESLPAGRHDLDLEVTVEPELGAPSTTRHRLRLEHTGTYLFEVLRRGDRTLTLAVAASAREEVVVSRPRAVSGGPPVAFKIEIQRVDAGRPVSVETDWLRTLVGEAVSYEFHLGGQEATEAATLRLRPRRILGEIVDIEAEVTGMLPDGDASHLLSRREEWMANRGTMSTLVFERGDPPSGYRFRVTPFF